MVSHTQIGMDAVKYNGSATSCVIETMSAYPQKTNTTDEPTIANTEAMLFREPRKMIGTRLQISQVPVISQMISVNRLWVPANAAAESRIANGIRPVKKARTVEIPYSTRPLAVRNCTLAHRLEDSSGAHASTNAHRDNAVLRLSSRHLA
jgi:hypothetical protein